MIFHFRISHHLYRFVLAIIFLCLNLSKLPAQTAKMVDNQANKETKALYSNLKSLAKTNIIFGHQDALAYGVEWKNWHKKRSDVKDVSGSHPGLVGWEMSKLGKSPVNIDSVDFEAMKGWMRKVYKMGGINSISWHVDNFVTGGSSWDVGDKVVKTIIPGGENHEAYKAKLDHFADFVNDLNVGFFSKRQIPLIFRPFHEHTGGWFWWGAPHCTVEEYKALWHFTVKYLRDEKGLHNLIWVYSPDVFENKAQYLEYYPGDEYVDILGIDDYHDLSVKGNTEDFLRRLRMLVEIANEKDKIATISETGQETIVDEKWWTEKVLNPIKSDPLASQVAYIMVWRNGRKDHYYGPYPGQKSVPDFLEFVADPTTLLQKDLPNLYRFK